MARPLLGDAFAHHVWATLRLLDACAALPPARLEEGVPGTFGPILGTLRHLVAADCAYLSVLTGGRRPPVDGDALGLGELRAEMERNGVEWAAVLAGDPPPDQDVVRPRADGSESHAPLGIRVAQALHHGSDHRSQVCTTLTTLGIAPPDIDAWGFADAQGRLSETPPTA